QNRISIVTSEAVVADRLDEVAAVAESMLAARRLYEKAAHTEFAALRAMLLREMGGVVRQREYEQAK
ncbi:MAG: hypothetical protein J2P31_01745, partial [Blastocatellia bacterium]|nr:hypothetical protein [Blastocatellia bacterium]